MKVPGAKCTLVTLALEKLKSGVERSRTASVNIINPKASSLKMNKNVTQIKKGLHIHTHHES